MLRTMWIWRRQLVSQSVSVSVTGFIREDPTGQIVIYRWAEVARESLAINSLPPRPRTSFSLQENKASKNLIEHLKDQIGDKETKVKELEEIQNTIMNMMQATKKKKTGWEW